MLVIVVCALLCGGAGFDDMADYGQARHDWLKTFLPLRNGIPAHDTFNRVFAALKPEAFLDCFLGWTQGLRQAMAQEIVAMDDKALRRALRRGAADALHRQRLGAGPRVGAGPAQGGQKKGW